MLPHKRSPVIIITRKRSKTEITLSVLNMCNPPRFALKYNIKHARNWLNSNTKSSLNSSILKLKTKYPRAKLIRKYNTPSVNLSVIILERYFSRRLLCLAISLLLKFSRPKSSNICRIIEKLINIKYFPYSVTPTVFCTVTSIPKA